MAILDIFKSTSEVAKATDAPKATELLKQDHDEVRALFREFNNAGERAYQEKGRLFAEIDRQLSVHAQIEEEIFYPAFEASRGKDSGKLVREAQEEHAIVKRLLTELGGLGPEDGTFDAKMNVLMEGVEHHAGEEEDDMFPVAEKSLGDERLQELGGQLKKRKEQLLKSGVSSGRKRASSARSRGKSANRASATPVSPKRASAKRAPAKRASAKRVSTKRVSAKRAPARAVASRAKSARKSASRVSRKAVAGRSRGGKKGSARAR